MKDEDRQRLIELLEEDNDGNNFWLIIIVIIIFGGLFMKTTKEDKPINIFINGEKRDK